MLIEAGGTLDALTKPAATSTLERYSPKELAGFLNALWDDQAHWPIPTDIRWEDFAPEKVMLRFKAQTTGSTSHPTIGLQHRTGSYRFRS